MHTKILCYALDKIKTANKTMLQIHINLYAYYAIKPENRFTERIRHNTQKYNKQ